jgi:acyl-CoA dehydrogenase
MDFSIPNELTEDLERFKEFIKAHIEPQLAAWYQKKEIPRQLFRNLGESGWYGLLVRDHHLSKGSVLREAMLTETVAKVSPGVAVAILAHIDLGLAGLYLFGSEYLQKEFGVPAIEGKTLMYLGNTEGIAGKNLHWLNIWP